MRYLLIITAFLFFIACQNNKNTTSDESSTGVTQLSVKPPLPSDSIQWLANNVGDVLIDLYHYEATLTLHKDQGSQRAVYFISPDPVTSDITLCQPFAAIIYTGADGVLYETEIYMDGECSFIRFRKNNEIVHHNKITKQAFDFFTDLLERFQPPQKQ